MRRPISAYLAGLSATRIFTRIYRSVCSRFGMAGVLFLFLKRQFYARRSRGTKIRRKKKRKKEKGEKERKGGGKKKENKSYLESRYEHEFLYWDVIALLPRRENKNEKRFRDHNDVRSRFPPFFLSFFSTCEYLLEEKKITIIKDTKVTWEVTTDEIDRKNFRSLWVTKYKYNAVNTLYEFALKKNYAVIFLRITRRRK